MVTVASINDGKLPLKQNQQLYFSPKPPRTLHKSAIRRDAEENINLCDRSSALVYLSHLRLLFKRKARRQT